MTQTTAIAKHLVARGHITPAIAFAEYGTTRLARVIHSLKVGGVKKVGLPITSHPRIGLGGTRFNEYRLPSGPSEVKG